MPKRIILRATKSGKRGLVLSKESVRQLRKFDREKRSIPTDDAKLSKGVYDAEPILTPLSIKGQKFYVHPKADKRATIPLQVVKRSKLRAGRVSFVVREPKRGDVTKSRGFFALVRTKNTFRDRYYLQSIEDININQVKKLFFHDLANFPKGMMSVYGRLAFIIFTDDRLKLPVVANFPTTPFDDFRQFPSETRDLIYAFVDDAFDKMFLKLAQPYVVDVALIFSEVSHFRVTQAGEIKNGERWKR